MLDLSEAAQLGLFEAPDGEVVRKPPVSEGLTKPIRQLMTPRDDLKPLYLNTQGMVDGVREAEARLKPLYLNTQGLRVGKSGEVLQVKEKEKTVQEVRIGEVCQVNLMGNIQISTQAVQSLCESGVPVTYFSMGGYFYGITTGLNTKNVALRRSQFRLADSERFSLELAQKLAGVYS